MDGAAADRVSILDGADILELSEMALSGSSHHEILTYCLGKIPMAQPDGGRYPF